MVPESEFLGSMRVGAALAILPATAAALHPEMAHATDIAGKS